MSQPSTPIKSNVDSSGGGGGGGGEDSLNSIASTLSTSDFEDADADDDSPSTNTDLSFSEGPSEAALALMGSFRTMMASRLLNSEERNNAANNKIYKGSFKLNNVNMGPNFSASDTYESDSVDFESDGTGSPFNDGTPKRKTADVEEKFPSPQKQTEEAKVEKSISLEGIYDEHFQRFETLVTKAFDSIRERITPSTKHNDEAQIIHKAGQPEKRTYNFDATQKIGIQFRTIGVTQNKTEGNVVVGAVDPAGQAARQHASLAEGDILVSVEGEPCKGIGLARCGGMIRAGLKKALENQQDDDESPPILKLEFERVPRVEVNQKDHYRETKTIDLAEIEKKMTLNCKEIFADLERAKNETAHSSEAIDNLHDIAEAATTKATDLKQQLESTQHEAALERQSFERALTLASYERRALVEQQAIQVGSEESQVIQQLQHRIKTLELQNDRERSEADAKLSGALEAAALLRQDVAKLHEEKMYARTIENIVPHIQRWYRFHSNRQYQLHRLRQVLKLDNWFKVLTTEIRFQFARGVDVYNACVEAMYLMLESKIRRPHYYGMVKLLQLESRNSTHEDVATDAFELYGEGRNWYVHQSDLALIATSMAILYRMMRTLQDQPNCSIDEAVFGALALHEQT